MIERLQKIISAAGVTSRRAAEDLIVEGRVRVNGKVVSELGAKADPESDHIKVDGKLINPKQPKVYVMLNKPAGYMTTMSDPERRPTVQDLLRGIKARVFPIGRLDYNTEGMLLLTNDGEFAHRVMHPSHELPKTYRAKVKGLLDDEMVSRLETGVYLDDGKTAPAQVKKIRKEEANSWIEITIHEGRKRQVRRMLDRVGHSVIRLKRVRMGNLSLGDLPLGRYRHLTGAEVNSLRGLASESEESRIVKPLAGKAKPFRTKTPPRIKPGAEIKSLRGWASENEKSRIAKGRAEKANQLRTKPSYRTKPGAINKSFRGASSNEKSRNVKPRTGKTEQFRTKPSYRTRPGTESKSFRGASSENEKSRFAKPRTGKAKQFRTRTSPRVKPR